MKDISMLERIKCYYKLLIYTFQNVCVNVIVVFSISGVYLVEIKIKYGYSEMIFDSYFEYFMKWFYFGYFIVKQMNYYILFMIANKLNLGYDIIIYNIIITLITFYDKQRTKFIIH